MSWSVSSKGSKEDVLANVAKQFDQSAANYLVQGLREGNDLLALRAVTLGAIHTLSVPDGHEVQVTCHGSRGDTSYMTASLSVQVVQASAG